MKGKPASENKKQFRTVSVVASRKVSNQKPSRLEGNTTWKSGTSNFSALRQLHRSAPVAELWWLSAMPPQHDFILMAAAGFTVLGTFDIVFTAGKGLRAKITQNEGKQNSSSS